MLFVDSRAAGLQMPKSRAAFPASAAGTFGDLLHYLRRRRQITQRDLGIAVGYSEAQISRLEKNRRAPDLTTLVALFVPALQIEDEPETVARLLELAAESRGEALAGRAVTIERVETRASTSDTWSLEPIPMAPPGAIDRRAVLDRLEAELRQHRAVVMCGLPGLGKTTLAAALARRQRDHQPVAWLTISPGVNDTAAALIRYLASFLFAHGQTALTAVIDPPRDAPALPLDQALSLLAASIAACGSPLVCIDDAHSLAQDPATLQVLRRLWQASPLRLLLISRSELPANDFTQIWLDGLTLEEGRALARQLCPELTPDLVDDLVARVAGNPILIRLAASQLRASSAPARAFLERLATQPQIETFLMEGVIGQLPAAAASLAQFLSVLRWPVDLLNEALIDALDADGRIGDLNAAILELRRRHLILHPAQAELHPLLRDRIRAQLVTRRVARRELHALAANWLERLGADPVEAAYHAVQAGAAQQVADLLTDRTEALQRRGQAAAAAELVTEALALDGNAPDLTRRLLVVRADLLVNGERAEEAADDYRKALALTDNPALRAQIAARLATDLMQRGRAAEGLQITETALAALPAADALLTGQLLAVQSAAQMLLAGYADAALNAERALKVAEQFAAWAPRDADIIRAQAHNTLGAVTHMRGDPDGAVRHWRAAVVAAQRAGLERLECRATFNIGNVYFVRGDLTRALEHYAKASTGLERFGERYIAGRVYGGIASVHYLRGDLDEALVALGQAVAFKREAGDGLGAAHSLGLQAKVLLALGRARDARALVEQALGEATDLGQTRSHAGLHVILAEAQLCDGDGHGAFASLAAAEAIPGATDEARFNADWRTHQATAYLVLGEVERARQIIDEPLSEEVGTEVEIERGLTRSVWLDRMGELEEARRIATELEQKALTAGNGLLARRAGVLARPEGAVSVNAIWGEVRGRSTPRPTLPA